MYPYNRSRSVVEKTTVDIIYDVSIYVCTFE